MNMVKRFHIYGALLHLALKVFTFTGPYYIFTFRGATYIEQRKSICVLLTTHCIMVLVTVTIRNIAKMLPDIIFCRF